PVIARIVRGEVGPPKLVQPWSIGMRSAFGPAPAACARRLRAASTRLQRVRPSFSQAPLSKRPRHNPPMLQWRRLMTHTFRELVVGGVLFAPFVTYAVAALAVVLISRRVLRFTG